MRTSSLSSAARLGLVVTSAAILLTVGVVVTGVSAVDPSVFDATDRPEFIVRFLRLLFHTVCDDGFGQIYVSFGFITLDCEIFKKKRHCQSIVSYELYALEPRYICKRNRGKKGNILIILLFTDFTTSHCELDITSKLSSISS